LILVNKAAFGVFVGVLVAAARVLGAVAPLAGVLGVATLLTGGLVERGEEVVGEMTVDDKLGNDVSMVTTPEGNVEDWMMVPVSSLPVGVLVLSKSSRR
jgi:hypothetical protein